ncbi:hypothetical protein [Actinacidiphila paucisporea]|nr:hypothetical protein [Actinacidiphila paucisporea]
MEEQPRHSATSSPPLTANLFQAPDFEEDESCLLEDAQGLA